MPEFRQNRNYQWHHTPLHTHREPICWWSVWKGVVQTHWLGGMLQPKHLTGPYLPWADCTAWYASVIFVRKKDTAVRARWVKKRPSDINSLPCGFSMIVSCLLPLNVFVLRSPARQGALHANTSDTVAKSSTCICSFRACGRHSTPECWPPSHACTSKHFGRPLRLSSFHRGHRHDDR